MMQRHIPVAAGNGSQSVHLIWSPGSGTISAHGLEDFLQGLNLYLGNPGPWSEAMMRVLTGTRVVNQGFASDFKLEAEGSDSLGGPSEERCVGDTFNDLGGLPNVEVTISFAIDKGLQLIHPEKQAQFQPECNWFVAEPDRGFQAADPRIQADGFPE